VTIGSFDGMHLGHQQILKRVIAQAQRLNIDSAVIIFEPQPHEFFAKTQSPVGTSSTPNPRLMRLREKVDALLAMGITKVVCLRFNAALRGLTAEQFIQQVLVQGLHVKHLEIGDDFRFGCDRRGDFALLQAAGAQQGFSVANSQTFIGLGERVSSTRVRTLLAANRLAEAANLLGKPYVICGRVIYGRQLGRTLGVPTANIGLGRYAAALAGVYAVRIQVAGEYFLGVANVGVKPTLEGKHKAVLEAHIFDFNRELYGQFITVEFCKALRDEQKFSTLAALKQQIHEDIRQAKDYFSGCN
jgi:riboflavin kinase/FMN adenylyltransferase